MYGPVAGSVKRRVKPEASVPIPAENVLRARTPGSEPNSGARAAHPGRTALVGGGALVVV